MCGCPARTASTSPAALATRPDLKVPLASGYTQMTELDLALLPKPFTLVDLRHALAELGAPAA